MPYPSSVSIRIKIDKYRTRQATFFHWFKQQVELNLSIHNFNPSEHGPKHLENLAERMRGNRPPQRIIDALDLAMKYRRAVNLWFETSEEGLRISTPRTRNQHARFLTALGVIKWFLIVAEEPEVFRSIAAANAGFGTGVSRLDQRNFNARSRRWSDPGVTNRVVTRSQTRRLGGVGRTRAVTRSQTRSLEMGITRLMANLGLGEMEVVEGMR